MLREYICLKSNLDPVYLKDRMKYNPSILEFYLSDLDMLDPQRIIDSIRYVQSKGTKVYLHHPPKFKGEYLDIISRRKDIRDFYDWSTELLVDICRTEDVKLIIHAHYARSESDLGEQEKLEEMRKRIEQFQKLGGEKLLWENTIEGLFSYQNPRFLTDLVEGMQLSICFDVSHAFISFQGDNRKLEEALKGSHNFICYLHVVDSMGLKHDSLPLGKGRINWVMVKPHLMHKDFIFEIDLRESNHQDCTQMIESAEYLLSIRP